MKLPYSILRNLIVLALSAGLVFVTQVTKQSSAAPSQSTNDYLELLRDNKDFKTECEEETPRDSLVEALSNPVTRTIDKYHEVINCLFNRRIEVMVKKMLKSDEDGKPLTKEDLQKIFILLSPPAFKFDKNRQPVGREECKGDGEDMNLSTYCLAQSAVNEYFKFREAMQDARRIEKEKAGQQFETVTGKKPGEAPDTVIQQRTLGGAVADIFQGEKALQSYGQTINRIDREIDLARKALDSGLAAYSELQMSLPLHRKYLEIIGALEEYRDHVRDIRKEVDLYPVTFLDVTTTQCT